MRQSATCSRDAAEGPRPRRALIAAVVVALAGAPAGAKVYMTQQEALTVAFPGGEKTEHRTAFLTDEQAAAVAADCGEPLRSKVVTWYEAAGRTAWFDTHLVRTLPETIMVVVARDGAIERIDILSFEEPEEYRPPEAWMRQLSGRKLDEEFSLRRGIRPITGASLSGRAIVSASRRVLALHRRLVLQAAEPPAKEAPAQPPKGKTP